MPRRLCLAIVAATLAALPCRADESPPAPAVTVDEPATAPPATTADGTTSVVAPTTEPPPPADVPPGNAFPSEPPPAVAPVRPPADGDAAVAPPADAAAPTPSAATALLAAALEAPDFGASTGQPPMARPLSLLEAVQRPGDPSRRLWIAQAYWKTSAAWAWLRWAGESVERLDLVAPGADPHDRAVLDVATAAARADLAEARSQLGVAQQELVDLARLPVTDPLPWPVDRPLASPYQTHFDAIFATRIATGRTRAIARTLPARHEALEARAAAAAAAGKALEMAEADHARGRRPIEAVVAAHAALVGQQREFLAAVRAYNLDIAEYAMAAADLSVPDDRFVSMLIGPPAAPRPVAP
ncbi:MAG: hypothetical protein ACKOZU_03450 [Planctomycetaceae bacterium]